MVKIKKALFPLSGDPITNGHLNIIKRARQLIEEIIVVILENDMKSSLLTLQERTEIAYSCIKSCELENVRVTHYEGLLSDYATQTGVFHIIRGIRNTDDLEYEIFLEYGHKKQNPKIDIIYFLAEPEHRTTSSSIARAILKKGGQIKDYVPLQAKQAMEEKLLEQYKLIITGSIASGKTIISNELANAFAQTGQEVHHIDFDNIVRNLYESMTKGQYRHLALEIIDYFGNNILEKNKISQSKLSQTIFTPTDTINQKRTVQEKLLFISNCFIPHIRSMYRKELFSKKGIILLNIPMAAENNMLYESNNNVLLITCSYQKQVERLVKNRGINVEEAKTRIENAGTTFKKRKLIENIISDEKVGTLLTFNNDGNQDKLNQRRIEELRKSILKLFNLT